jgi:hypothetical protein
VTEKNKKKGEPVNLDYPKYIKAWWWWWWCWNQPLPYVSRRRYKYIGTVHGWMEEEEDSVETEDRSEAASSVGSKATGATLRDGQCE